MKWLVSVFTLVVVLGFSSAMSAAEPSRAPGSNPSDAVRGFYRWYVTALIGNGQPMKNRKEMKRFVTERLLKEIEIKEKGLIGLDYDYFVASQDFDDLWAKNITVSNLKVSGTKATAEVLLAGKGEMRRRLQVSLVEDDSVWKVDKVKGRE
jgi:hypothetical protein